MRVPAPHGWPSPKPELGCSWRNRFRLLMELTRHGWGRKSGGEDSKTQTHHTVGTGSGGDQGAASQRRVPTAGEAAFPELQAAPLQRVVRSGRPELPCGLHFPGLRKETTEASAQDSCRQCRLTSRGGEQTAEPGPGSPLHSASESNSEFKLDPPSVIRP